MERRYEIWTRSSGTAGWKSSASVGTLIYIHIDMLLVAIATTDSQGLVQPCVKNTRVSVDVVKISVR